RPGFLQASGTQLRALEKSRCPRPSRASCHGGALPQAIPRRRGREVRRRPGSRDRGDMRGGVPARGEAVPGSQPRGDARSAGRGPRDRDGVMEIQHLRFLIPGWRDSIEILLVAVIIYRVLVFLAGTRALQILVGLVILGVMYFVALAFKFNIIAT